MVGSYHIFRRNSVCYSVLISIFFCAFLFCSGGWSAGCAEQTERVILYLDPDSSSHVGFFPENSTLSGNCSIILQAPSLGFLVAEIPRNESVYYQNELLNVPWISDVTPDSIRMPESVYVPEPGDPDLSDLWGLNRTRVPDAWSILSSHGSVPNCTIAILDTGIDPNHEDLAGVIAPGGFDWVGNTSLVTDPDGHGTSLAGIVGASMGNSRGGAGIARVSLLPERVGTNQTGIYSSLSAMGIRDAADKGARIILMGYGGPGQSPAEEAAIAYAVKKGCILISPAGNDASNEGHYPSDYYDVISVGSTAKSDGLSYFSNYGIFVEMVAPGEDIRSTWPDNQYRSITGTSPAAAFVAGAAALVLAADPTLNRSQVRTILTDTAHDLGRTGRDIYYGYGLLDIGTAVNAAKDGKVHPVSRTISRNSTDSSVSIPKNGSSASVSPFEIKRSGPGSLTTTGLNLESGWNFISLPSSLGSGKNGGEIFQGINTDGRTIWRYDAQVQDWISLERGDPLLPLEGLLVYSDRQVSLPLVLKESQGNATVNMSKGWNLVGIPGGREISAAEGLANLSPDWVSLLIFNSSSKSYEPAIIPGANGTHSDSRTLSPYSSFWVYMNREGILGLSS